MTISNMGKVVKVTIKQKLMLIIMAISTITLLLSASLFTLFQIREIRNSMVSELTILASVIGSNTQASLAFNDPVDAHNILADLRRNPSITHAQIFNANNELFAFYTNPGEKIASFPQPMIRQNDYFEFKDKQLILFQPIKDRYGTLGNIYLETNLDKLTAQIQENLRVTISIIIAVLLISYLLTSRLQKIISAPIHDLSETAKTIREDQDYNVRVDRNDYVEIRQLCDSFNSMLDKIQDREETLRHLASFDPLTKLANRNYFMDLLTQAIKRGKRKSHSHALLFFDLDRFKHINDSLGHSAGDELLIQVAKRMSSILRGDDTVARLGGDEYTILLQEISGLHQAAEIANRILEILDEPFLIQNHRVVITTSIGIVIYPDHGKTPEALIKNADTAMYQAKHAGGNYYRFFTEEMNIMAEKRQHLEEALRHALINDEIILNYQPQVSLSDGRIIGTEILCRWRKDGVIILPNEFIPIAEETGLIIPLTHIIMRKAMCTTKKWVDTKLFSHTISINVAARHFHQSDLIHSLDMILQETGLAPAFLDIEITEAAVMEQTEQSIETMNMIKDRGITMSIDDFGTGYSSLSYLKKFPIDKLKIDKSFIHDMDASEINTNIVRSIIDLGHNLKLKVVAEGVETERQLKLLIDLECDIMQGYYFSEPVSAEEMEKMLKQHMNLYQNRNMVM